MKQEPYNVICKDGVSLKFLLILDATKALFNSIVALAQRKKFIMLFDLYYAKMVICCLWHYRGSSASASDNMQNCNYTYSDHGKLDMPATKTYLNERFTFLYHRTQYRRATDWVCVQSSNLLLS